MKTLNQYILEDDISNLNEGILQKLIGWFKNIHKNQQNLEKNTIQVDTKNIKGPKEPTKISELLSNKEEMNLITDKKVGFPQSAIIMQQENKYLKNIEISEGNTFDYDVLVNRYFYVDGNNTYSIGLVLYDIKNKSENNFANLINIEVIQQVENISEVQKFIHTIFEEEMKKQQFKGVRCINPLPRMKGTITKLGYKTSNENKNILIKEIK